MTRVLIAGATGYLGGYLVRECKKQGFWVRALARNASKLQDLSDCIDEVVIGQVTEAESIRGICQDIDLVFSSIGITKQKDNLTYMDVDYQGNKNLLDEAQREGISKYIYVSVLNAEQMRHLKGVQAKLRFVEELKHSGLNRLIVCPNGFFSDMLEYLQMARKGKGFVFGSGECRINPIHGEDLAEVCVRAAGGDETEIEVGGPDVLSHHEILALAFETLGKPVRISRIPLWVRNATLAILRLLTSAKTYGPVEFFMTVLSRDMTAPCHGQQHLRDFFRENQEPV